jgi:hypothetical protein
MWGEDRRLHFLPPKIVARARIRNRAGRKRLKRGGRAPSGRPTAGSGAAPFPKVRCFYDLLIAKRRSSREHAVLLLA